MQAHSLSCALLMLSILCLGRADSRIATGFLSGIYKSSSSPSFLATIQFAEAFTQVPRIGLMNLMLFSFEAVDSTSQFYSVNLNTSAITSTNFTLTMTFQGTTQALVTRQFYVVSEGDPCLLSTITLPIGNPLRINKQFKQSSGISLSDLDQTTTKVNVGVLLSCYNLSSADSLSIAPLSRPLIKRFFKLSVFPVSGSNLKLPLQENSKPLSRNGTATFVVQVGRGTVVHSLTLLLVVHSTAKREPLFQSLYDEIKVTIKPSQQGSADTGIRDFEGSRYFYGETEFSVPLIAGPATAPFLNLTLTIARVGFRASANPSLFAEASGKLSLFGYFPCSPLQYFENGSCRCRNTSSNFGDCKPCRFECHTCDERQCLTCKTTGQNGKCICDKGFNMFVTGCTCDAPSQIIAGECRPPQGTYSSWGRSGECPLGCPKCEFSSATNSAACRECARLANRVRTPINGSCPPEDGYFEVPNEVFCPPCHESCKTCKGPEESDCLTCSESSTIDNGKCLVSCLRNQFFDGVSCQSCAPSCASCSDQRVCTSCIANAFRVSSPTPSRQCPCTAGYRETTNGMCIPNCNPNCLTCSSLNPNTCETCDESLNRVLNSQTKECDCKKGFYYSDLVCRQCHMTCETCRGPGLNQCLTCNSSLRSFKQTKNSCDCLEGYSDSPNGCLKCHNTCLSCTGPNSNQCTKCNQSNHLILSNNNSCNCVSNSFMSGSSCILCHPTCLTCSAQGPSSCSTCDASQNLKLNSFTKTCDCNVGFYKNVQVCSKCHNVCFKCSGPNKNQCTQCNSTKKLQLNSLTSTCQCASNSFLSSNDDCVLCHPTCLTCDGPNQNMCRSCNSTGNFSLNNLARTCECVAGYYKSSGNTCLKCSNSCLTCSGPNQNQCTECNPGFYLASGICTLCHSTCLTCSSSTRRSCLSCDAQKKFVFNQTAKTCVCINGTYISRASCLPCDPNCLGCTGNAKNCTSCSQNRVMDLTTRYCACPAQKFSNASGCFACHSECESCSGPNNNNCLSCPSGLKLTVQNTCGCPINSSLSSGGTCICKSGSYNNGTDCQLCDSNCATCIGTSTKCLSCGMNSFLMETISQCMCMNAQYTNNYRTSNCCPQNTYRVQQFCLPCDSTCFTCKGSTSFDCTVCQFFLIHGTNRPARYLVNGMCKCITFQQWGSTCATCQYGQYFNKFSQMCQNCFSSCFSCAGPKFNQCLTCKFSKPLIQTQTILDPWSNSLNLIIGSCYY